MAKTTTQSCHNKVQTIFHRVIKSVHNNSEKSVLNEYVPVGTLRGLGLVRINVRLGGPKRLGLVQNEHPSKHLQ